MKRLFKEFILGKNLAHVLFEREVKKLFDEFHQKWRDEHWDNPCKGMTLRMFTGFIKKEGIIVTAARRKPRIRATITTEQSYIGTPDFQKLWNESDPNQLGLKKAYEGMVFKIPPQYE